MEENGQEEEMRMKEIGISKETNGQKEKRDGDKQDKGCDEEEGGDKALSSLT